MTIQLIRNFKVMQFDSEDWAKLHPFVWTVNTRGYVVTNTGLMAGGNSASIYMHRLVMNVGNLKDNPNIFVDHINHNKSDNRKVNLRIANKSQNCQNRFKKRLTEAKYKGIYLQSKYNKHPTDKYIKAVIIANGKRYFLGTFETQEQAALAYNEAAIKYHGEFAQLNVI
jgi:hypothetical protein